MQRVSEKSNGPSKWWLLLLVGAVAAGLAYWLWRRYRKKPDNCPTCPEKPCPEKECPTCPPEKECPKCPPEKECQKCPPEKECPRCPPEKECPKCPPEKECPKCPPEKECPEHICPKCPEVQPCPTSAFNVSYLIGKRGKLRVDGRGYVVAKNPQTPSGIINELVVGTDIGTAPEWILERAPIDGVPQADVYRFRGANHPGSDKDALYFSVSATGAIRSVKKSVRTAESWESFKVKHEGGWSNRFHLVNPNIKATSAITPTDWIVFEEV